MGESCKVFVFGATCGSGATTAGRVVSVFSSVDGAACKVVSGAVGKVVRIWVFNS